MIHSIFQVAKSLHDKIEANHKSVNGKRKYVFDKVATVSTDEAECIRYLYKGAIHSDKEYHEYHKMLNARMTNAFNRQVKRKGGQAIDTPQQK